MQRKPLGCVSRTGLVMSLVLVMAVAGSVLIWGGGLLSPGPLTAVHPRDRPGWIPLAWPEFGNRCNLCHRPFSGTENARCTACHTDVSAQIADESGVHGQPAQAKASCATCHTDHQGHDATIVGGGLEAFDHTAAFPLTGAHASLACTACHTDGRYQGTPRECAGCHQDPHNGANGGDCNRCHNTTSWDVSAIDHTGLTDCQSCHTPPPTTTPANANSATWTQPPGATFSSVTRSSTSITGEPTAAASAVTPAVTTRATTAAVAMARAMKATTDAGSRHTYTICQGNGGLDERRRLSCSTLRTLRWA